MENQNNLRKIILDELYEIAYNNTNEIITEEGLSDKPVNIIPITPESPKPTDATNKDNGTIINALQQKTDQEKAKKIARYKVTQAALKCGWGKDVEGYKKSGWKCNNTKDPFSSTAELEEWRGWLQRTYPAEFKKLGIPAIESMKKQADITMYYKHIIEYKKYQKENGRLTPGVDDDEISYSATQMLFLSAAAIIALKSIAGGLGLFTLIKFLRKRKSGGADAAIGSKAQQLIRRVSAQNLDAMEFADDVLTNPSNMRTELNSLANKSSEELRAGLAAVSGKSPSKFSESQISLIRKTLKDPALQTKIIVATRKELINKFLSRGGGGIKAKQLLKYLTASEQKQYGAYIRKIAKSRGEKI